MRPDAQTPLVGIYSFPAAGEPLRIYEGPGFVGDDAIADLDVRMPLDRKADVRWTAKVRRPHMPGPTVLKCVSPWPATTS